MRSPAKGRFKVGMLFAVATLLAQPASAAQAPAVDRARMSLAVADYEHVYGDKGGLPIAPLLGWAVVERPWALAKWSGDGAASGFILLKYSGGQWNVEDVSATTPAHYKNAGGFYILVQDPGSTPPARTRRLIEHGVPASTAAKLVADLGAYGDRRDPWLGVPYFPAHYRPEYLALDYGKPGQPTLTAKEIARIREVLALVKPCQRAMVRYAFPENAPFVLFFQGQWHPCGP